jgi:hypothetical protein
MQGDACELALEPRPILQHVRHGAYRRGERSVRFSARLLDDALTVREQTLPAVRAPDFGLDGER